MSQSIVSDSDLILRCRSGDQSAFRELVERYRRRAYWVAYHLVGDADEAFDICQEAFLRVFRALPSFDLKRNFYTWLYRIVHNLSIDMLRKRGSGTPMTLEETENLIPGGQRPDESVSLRELGGEIEQCLQELPEKYRTVVVLRDINELSCKEIARIVDCTHATVRWRLHRARQMFRSLWELRQSRSGHQEDQSGPGGSRPQPDHWNDE